MTIEEAAKRFEVTKDQARGLLEFLAAKGLVHKGQAGADGSRGRRKSVYTFGPGVLANLDVSLSVNVSVDVETPQPLETT